MANHDSTIRLDFLDLWPDLGNVGEDGRAKMCLTCYPRSGAGTDAPGPGPPGLGTSQLSQLSRQGQGIKLSSAVAGSECGESHGSNLLLMVAARLGSESASNTPWKIRESEQSTLVPAGPGQHLRIQPEPGLVGSSDD